MAHSNLSTLLLVAPTGIYRGRVAKGIDLVLGSQTVKKETKIRVVLIAGADWVKIDESYKRDFVDRLKHYVLKTWKEQAGLAVVCDDMILEWGDEEYLTGWLLKELSAFFKTYRGEAEAFIDLTSGTKEWLFAAINALSFFPRVVLYNVRATGVKKPSQYEDTEKDNPGIPKLEVVRTGAAVQPLPQWIQPKNEKGKPNVHYRLFETIFELAESIAVEKGLDPSTELDKVWVPIQERSGLDEYRRRLKKNLKGLPHDFVRTFHSVSGLRKSISKYLTGVEFFGLFEVKGRSVRMTLRAVMLGQALFARKR